MRLRRYDGAIYLDRWGIEGRLCGIYLHRMQAPDPGVDLHDHPWTFVTIPLFGGYTEERALGRRAPHFAQQAERAPGLCLRGQVERRRWLHPRMLRLDECHRITRLTRRTVWTLVLRGPRRRRWGFYLPHGWVDEHTYDETVRAERRDMWNEVGT